MAKVVETEIAYISCMAVVSLGIDVRSYLKVTVDKIGYEIVVDFIGACLQLLVSGGMGYVSEEKGDSLGYVIHLLTVMGDSFVLEIRGLVYVEGVCLADFFGLFEGQEVVRT